MGKGIQYTVIKNLESQKGLQTIQGLRSQFLQPDGIFTPMPFWFWNGRLEREELLRQLRDFRDKGVEGFVLHPRIGIPDTLGYLSDEFMTLVEAVVDEAASMNMRVILYDEGMYPSGSANGEIVRRNPEFASRGLIMIEQPMKNTPEWSIPLEEGDRIVSVQAILRTGNDLEGIEASKTQIIEMAEDFGSTVSYTPPDAGEWSYVAFIDRLSLGTIRGIHYGQDDGEPGAPRAADLLNPEAVQMFIELTHERYYGRIGRHFGSSIIAMFTDEPDLLGRKHRKGMLPWTAGFLEEFIRSGNREEELILLWLESGDYTADIRRRYRKAVRHRMEQSFYKPLHDWCEAHGIALTGHPAASDDMGLLRYFHIPGQDIVWRWLAPEGDLGITGKHSTMGKCSADSARHRNKLRNLNECFGVCGKGNSWALTADDTKWYLDWLFVRGVNLICPHAFYYSIEGERLHERAPDVGPNNIWWPEYSRFSQYIKRMSWVMTESINQPELCVLCRADHLSWELARPLYEGQMEFNYLEEELLQEEAVLKDGMMSIANQRYRIVLLEDVEQFEPNTREKLKEFVRHGGIVMEHNRGAAAPVSYAEPGWEVLHTLESVAERVGQLLSHRAEFKPVSPGLRISHVIKDHIHLYVLVNEGETAIQGSVFINGEGKPELWDAWSGTITPVQAEARDGGMDIALTIDRRQCLVLALDPDASSIIDPVSTKQETVAQDLSEGWQVDGAEGAISLTSWTEWEGREHFSGTVTYTRELEWKPSASYTDVILDLGEVHEMAKVFLNGQLIDTKLWSPYRCSLSDYLLTGKNVLQVEVTNTLANRYDQVSLPSGMLGPITLTICLEV